VLWFFFSSRRRHTRCLSDWSSDVCSSDLVCSFLRRLHPIAGIRRGARLPSPAKQSLCSQQNAHRLSQREVDRNPCLSRGERHQEIGRASCRERVESRGGGGGGKDNGREKP